MNVRVRGLLIGTSVLLRPPYGKSTLFETGYS